MIIDKYTPLQNIVVFQPRWHDRKVLIAGFKVGEHNKITFPKTPSMKGDFYLSGKTIRKYPKESNGKIMCYVVPIDELQPLEINEKDWRLLN